MTMVYGDMNVELPIAHFSNQALLEETERLASSVRRATARLIAALAEVDARRLWADEGCSSLYDYCTRVLRFSEQEAYLRVEVARVAQRFPVALEMLDGGELTLTNVGLLKPHLTPENHAALLEAARGRSKREVVRQVAALRDDAGACPEPVAAVIPISASRFRLTVDIEDETYDKLQRATDLLRHAMPDGDLDRVLDRALTALLRDLARTKYAATNSPRAEPELAGDSRYIPASVRRVVWQRDGGRCAFIGIARPMLRDGVPRISSPQAVRAGRRIHDRQHRTSLSGAQSAGSRAVLRRGDAVRGQRTTDGVRGTGSGPSSASGSAAHAPARTGE